MKTQNIHIGSFLIGLLAGGVILVALALSQPLRAETHTSQLLREQSRQIQITTSKSVEKTWSQVQSEMALNGQKTVQDIRQSMNKEVGGLVSWLHSPSLQPCTWFTWLDRQFGKLESLAHIHSGLFNPPACSS